MGLNNKAVAWTDEQSSVLAELIAAGRSSSQAAEAINAQFGTIFTRNSIIGRCNRLGLQRVTRPGDGAIRVRKHKDRVRIVADGGRSGGLRIITSRQSADVIKLRCVAIECVTPFDDVTGCWYPNDGDAHLWCNGPRQEGSSFCPAHHALVWVPPRPSEHKSWRPAA